MQWTRPRTEATQLTLKTKTTIPKKRFLKTTATRKTSRYRVKRLASTTSHWLSSLRTLSGATEDTAKLYYSSMVITWTLRSGLKKRRWASRYRCSCLMLGTMSGWGTIEAATIASCRPFACRKWTRKTSGIGVIQRWLSMIYQLLS